MVNQRVTNQRVRAIILYRGRLVMIKRVKPTETYYVLPGGGVEPGESLAAALEREVAEETGLRFRAGEPVGEFTFVNRAGEHQHETVFTGEVTGGRFGLGDGPEFHPENGYIGTHEPTLVPLDQVAKTAWNREPAKQIVLSVISQLGLTQSDHENLNR